METIQCNQCQFVVELINRSYQNASPSMRKMKAIEELESVNDHCPDEFICLPLLRLGKEKFNNQTQQNG